MATYNTAFGSLPGYNEMLGTTNTTGGGQQNVYGQRTQSQRTSQTQPAPAQTFAQLQQRGMARPAPPQAPQAQAFAQYGGSQQAQQMRQNLQQQLQQFSQAPSRFDTQAFQQIRGAQAANIQSEFQEQQRQLNEDLARRGLSASNIAASGLGRLGGAQARALADLDAQLLQRAAETQAADRAALLQAGQGFTELAGAQDLAQFEANRVAQAATFENQLRAAQFGQQQFEQGGQEAFQAAQAEEAAQQAARQFDLAATGQAGQLSLDLQRLLGQQEVERAQLTGTLGGQQTLAGQQFAEQRRQFDIEQALQQQLGLGGLTLEQQRLAFQQTDAQAERALREAMQTRELSAQEKQQLADITARQALQTQQITEEARQFGLSLTEQQAARLQQLNISTQELAQESTRIANQASQFGQQLTMQQAQNQAQTNLEQQRINEAIESRLTGVSESLLERNLRQSLQSQQISEQARQFNIDQSIRQALGLTEATGFAYRPLTTGTGVDAYSLPTATLAREAQTAQQQQFNMEQQLRRQLGLTELTGYTYDPTGSFISGGQTTVGERAQQTARQSATYQAELAAAQQRMAASQYQSDLLVQLIAALKAAGGTVR